MKYYFLFFFSIGFLYLGCAVRQTPKPAAPPPKVYPEEVNFLRTMAIGDTVFLFIKESGYFTPHHNHYQQVHLTCYTRQELCRVDTFLFKSREFFFTPGGSSQGGLNFELDTLKFQLQKALDACKSLEPDCVDASNESSLSYHDPCLWKQPMLMNKYYELRWLNYTTLGMSDKSYQEWRFNPPSHVQLKQWRVSMAANSPDPIYRYEVLSFYKDTCKISYCDNLPTSYAYDFSRLE